MVTYVCCGPSKYFFSFIYHPLYDVLQAFLVYSLTIKGFITTTTLICFLFFRKIRLDISCKLSSRWTIHMKFHIFFSLKNNNVNFRVSSATNLLGALRVSFFKYCCYYSSIALITLFFYFYNKNNNIIIIIVISIIIIAIIIIIITSTCSSSSSNGSSTRTSIVFIINTDRDLANINCNILFKTQMQSDCKKYSVGLRNMMRRLSAILT